MAKFTAPDGKEFDSKAQYRDYMMNNFFSFKGKTNERSLVKKPNDVNGQAFDIADCDNCSMVVMDKTDQIQIDNLTNCRVFIGACSSTIFIRNCSNCVFHTCCRQLRLREVTNCILYSFSQGETHIEFCNGLQFAPFIGGYAEQQAHFQQIGLDSQANEWFSVYDHNDPDKTGTNWALLPFSSYEQPWFPTGEDCEPFIKYVPAPVKSAAAAAAEDSGDGVGVGVFAASKASSQVGQTFGLEQMMADAKRLEEEEKQQQKLKLQGSPSSGMTHLAAATEKIHMETALLVASAIGKGIDVAIWLGEDSESGSGTKGSEISSEDFGNKLSSLASMVGLNEDWETKKELELATSLAALRAATASCTARKTPTGQVTVDVPLFIRACKDKVELYLDELEIDQPQSPPRNRPGADSPQSVESRGASHQPPIESPNNIYVPYGDAGEYDGAGDQYGSFYKESTESHSLASDSVGGGGGGAVDRGERRPSGRLNRYDPEADTGAAIRSMSTEEYIEDLKSKGGAYRPPSAPAGREQNRQSMQDSPPVQQRQRPHTAAVPLELETDQYGVAQSALGGSSAALPSSPYDEQVEFDDADSEYELVSDEFENNRNDDDNSDDDQYVANRSGVSSRAAAATAAATAAASFLAAEGFSLSEPHRDKLISPKRSGSATRMSRKKENKHWVDENRQRYVNSTPSDSENSSDPDNRLGSKRPQELRPATAEGATATDGLRGPAHGNRTSQSIEGRRRFTSSGYGQFGKKTLISPRRSSSGTLRQSRHGTEGGPSASREQLHKLKEFVEDLLRSTVKKADLYHNIQVSLGLIQPYLMVPPRGQIVTSQPREWLTMRDLQTAFLSSRLTLSEPQLFAVHSLVVEFSKEYEKLYPENPTYREGGEGSAVASSKGSPARSMTTSRVMAVAASAALGDTACRPKSKAVLGVNRTLNADWLRRYMVHLRLTKKSSPIIPVNDDGSMQSFTGNASTGTSHHHLQQQERPARPSSAPPASRRREASSEGAVEPLTAQRGNAPKQWQEWLGEKLLKGIAKGQAKPKEFEKALAGNACHLSKEDINLILSGGAGRGAHRAKILSDEELKEEIECRVESWRIDMSGRRDFQHVINLSTRMWAKQQQRMNPAHPTWQRMRPAEQAKVQAELTQKLVDEKRAELFSAERVSGAVTIDLFWKFDAARKEDRYSTRCAWADWLQQHLKKFKDDIARFKETVEVHHRAVAQQFTSRRTVAGLLDIESKLDIVAQSLGRDQQIELRKAVTALRRATKQRNLAQGTVVVKDDFDAYIKPVLSPHLKNGGSFYANGASTSDSAEAAAQTEKEKLSPPRTRRGQTKAVILDWSTRNEKLGEQFYAMFQPSIETAVRKVLELEEAQKQKNQSNFVEWEQRKKEKIQEKLRKEAEDKKKAAKEQEEREKKAAKAYAKWKKLRNSNKYRSKIDKKTHPVPIVHAPSHDRRWHVEKDLNSVYKEQERKF